jgi:hypothetical protein
MDGLDGTSHSLAKFVHEVPNQRWDIVSPLTQRWNRDRENVAGSGKGSPKIVLNDTHVVSLSQLF